MVMKKLVFYLLMVGLLVTILVFSACSGEKETTTMTTTLPAITSTTTTTITSTQPPIISTTTITSTQPPTTVTVTVTTTQATTITEEKGSPMAGEWVASIEIGDIWFIVNDDGTGITEYGIHIPGELSCGNKTASGITITFFYPSGPVPITDNQFNLERTTSDDWEIVIEGSFDVTGTQASGTWQISSGEATCASGTWTSTRG